MIRSLLIGLAGAATATLIAFAAQAAPAYTPIPGLQSEAATAQQASCRMYYHCHRHCWRHRGHVHCRKYCHVC